MRRTIVGGLTLALLLVVAPRGALATYANVSDFRVINSPFTSNNVSTRHQAGAVLSLVAAATVTLTVETPLGGVVRTLAAAVAEQVGNYSWNWDGYDDSANLAPDGDYVAHLVATGGLGTDDLTLPIRKGLPPIYPANPGAITILINPGHGGANWGAVTRVVKEKFLNLDIGLRLRRLLQAAGINVVMTRTTDVHIPDPEWDVNGDGFIGPPTTKDDDWDGLAYRIDIGNEARADLHIFNHNNGSSIHTRRGTETYTGMYRSWTPEGITFATDVQSEELSQLDTFRSATYYPIDGGVKNGKKFYTLSPYSLYGPKPREPRPALQPTLLTESLYVSNPIERGLLLQGQVRESIAIALYLGIRDYLATRDYGIRYTLVDGPTDVTAGAASDYHVQVTNTGNLTSSGWQLQLNDVPAVPFYDGSGAVGDPMGSVVIPDGLVPGQSVTLDVPVTAPPTAGAWLVKGDVFIGGTDRPYLSQRGVVAIQVPLTTEP
jgi:N-acetylmuramoyl-L-alanine amidase